MPNRLILALITFLVACSPFKASDPLPITQTIAVAITPALQPLSETLQACASEQKDVILQMLEIPAKSLMEVEVDLYFQLGAPQKLLTFAAPIAWEEIVVIAHPSANIAEIDYTNLRGIFSGSIGGEGGLDIQVWVPLEEDEARVAFEDAVLPGGLVSSLAKLAPNPAAMLAEVAADTGAIGYLPKAWVTEEVGVFDLALRLPLLVLANEEPVGPALMLISCLQSDAGQAAIGKRYIPWSDG